MLADGAAADFRHSAGQRYVTIERGMRVNTKRQTLTRHVGNVGAVNLSLAVSYAQLGPGLDHVHTYILVVKGNRPVACPSIRWDGYLAAELHVGFFLYFFCA